MTRTTHAILAPLLWPLLAASAGCGGGGGAGTADLAPAPLPDLSVTSGDLASPSEVVLTNAAMGMPCDDFVAPAAGEEKHRAAARLTPPRYPFTVTAVRYGIAHGMHNNGMNNCRAELAHAVELFTDAAAAPPATPKVLARIDVPTLMGAPPMERIVDLKLPQPVTIEAGQHLFVAVQYAGKLPNVLCVQSCLDDPRSDRNYWSNADAPPYKWATLKSFDIDANLRIEAIGK